jgi:hypothetical protein
MQPASSSCANALQGAGSTAAGAALGIISTSTLPSVSDTLQIVAL